MLTNITHALAALLLVAAILLMVQRPAGSQQAQDLLDLCDLDGDGRLSRSEVERVADADLSFDVMDLDGSGSLEPWEIDVLLRHTSPMKWGLRTLPRVL